MRRKGWDQKDLAKEMGVTPSMVNHWIQGNSEPTLRQLEQLSVLYGEPIAWFFGETDTPESARTAQILLRILNSDDPQRVIDSLSEGERDEIRDGALGSPVEL